MASSISPFYSLNVPYRRHQELKYTRIRSQSLSDDGTSASLVDANLGILRRRISETRMKERLEAWCRLRSNGWMYQSGYQVRYKRDAMVSESLELMGSISGALGFVFLSGSICIFFVSVLVHLGK